jgi:hypothetical protein
MGKNSRMEDYNTNRTGMFYIGGWYKWQLG